MPRVHTVTKNRKVQECRKCGEKIPVNAGYRHWSFRYGGKVTRCLKCPSPRPSELTQSGYYQQAYAAQENFEDAIGELERDETFAEAVAGLLEDVISTAESIKDEYQEALDAWEHGNYMLEEKVEGAESWYDALEEAKNDIESKEPDMPDELDDDASDEEKQEYEEAKEAALDTFCNEVEEAANDPLYDLNF